VLRDWQTPGDAPPVSTTTATATGAAGAGATWRAASWTPARLAQLAAAVRRGGEALRALPGDRLAAAWQESVAAFRDPASAERRALAPALAERARLSDAGLAAALEAVLGGVAGRHAERVLAAAPSADRSPVLVVLASNLPALAVQPLLPILARRRPALLKSPSAEPLFSAAFAAALVRREPVLGEAVAALTWRGGQAALEEPLLAAAGRVLAYGDAAAIADLQRRAPGKLVAYGPQTSLAVLGANADVRRAAAGLARDVALFDQRGCLSVAAVYTTGDAGELAAALAGELAELARRWPPGATTVAEAAAVRQVRDEAALRGLRLADLPPAAGTVIVEADARLRPTPGLRTVRVHRLAAAAELPRLLAAWHGRLQGVALAGFDAAAQAALTAGLRALGVSRFAPPGELQSPDTRWHNGGVDPLRLLA